MISSVERRRTFADFRREGLRVRHGAVRLNHLPPDRLPVGSATPQLAFAIGRHVGNAVARNRVRRRLRAAFVDVWRARADRSEHPSPAGAFLLTGTPAVLSAPYTQLTADLEHCLDQCLDRAGRPAGPDR